MNQNTQYVEEDEIDLRELFATISRYKYKILLFSLVVTLMSVVYTLSKPNVYASSTLLVPQEQAKSSIGGGLSALAGMAGISIGGGGNVDVATSFDTVLKDFSLQKKMIKKYNLAEKIKVDESKMVFALGYDDIYKLFHSSEDSPTKELTEDTIMHETYKALLEMISVTSDKESGIITLQVESPDRYLAKELVEIYLTELTNYLREMDMSNIQTQIDYYMSEIENVDEISMKDQLGQLASALIQKKVLSKANKYYNVKQLIKPQVAYIKDKTKPKRALVVIVAFITSLILGVFGVFFIEFLKQER
jgi:uncharacterized protein involved in exopolysaccharide biosynthesis